VIALGDCELITLYFIAACVGASVFTIAGGGIARASVDDPHVNQLGNDICASKGAFVVNIQMTDDGNARVL
jgi:hypothetical protein